METRSPSGSMRTLADPLSADIERVVRDALAEDVGPGDITTEATVDGHAPCRAELVLKEPGVVCGLAVAEAVFRSLERAIYFEPLVADCGSVDDPPRAVARVEGPARAIFAGERTALNLLGRLSGVATQTRRFVDAIDGTGAEILDTRKTTPGLRALEKYAVRCGGGRNHRFGLFDEILIKDNHVALAGGIADAVARARLHRPSSPLQVEAETLDDVREALASGADSILLDNMAPATIAAAVKIAGGQARLEASGGVTLETVRAIAETGVDFVSAGALTHSARSLDVSLEVS
jgi:nicotinate-nucleotide pyrophosphorylase (carboxylating)